jgi:hypothetical protein
VETEVLRQRATGRLSPDLRSRRRWSDTRPITVPSDPIAYPAPADTPDWSPETLALLDDLTPLQRAFVEWYASGCSAAAAYRKASGRDPGPTARNNGAQLLNKPHVRVAVAAALRDRNVGARCDREWMLQKLYEVAEQCERSGRVADMNALIGALRLMARLQGELQPLSRRRALPPPPEPPESPAQRRCRERIEEYMREADARAAADRAAKAAGDRSHAAQQSAAPPANAATADPPTMAPPQTVGQVSPPVRDVVGQPPRSPRWIRADRAGGKGRLEAQLIGGVGPGGAEPIAQSEPSVVTSPPAATPMSATVPPVPPTSDGLPVLADDNDRRGEPTPKVRVPWGGWLVPRRRMAPGGGFY